MSDDKPNVKILVELNKSGLTLEPIDKSAFLKRKNKDTERSCRSSNMNGKKTSHDEIKTVKRKYIPVNKRKPSIVDDSGFLRRTTHSQDNLEPSCLTLPTIEPYVNLPTIEPEINHSQNSLNYRLKQLPKDIHLKIPSIQNGSNGIGDSKSATPSSFSDKIQSWSNAPSQTSQNRSFSPLPSTSTDNKIFEVNSRNFLSSLESSAPCKGDAAFENNKHTTKSVREVELTRVDGDREQIPTITETFYNTSSYDEFQDWEISEVMSFPDNSVWQVTGSISLADSQNDLVGNEIVIEDSILRNSNSLLDGCQPDRPTFATIVINDDDDDFINVTGLRRSGRLLGHNRKCPTLRRTEATEQQIVETVDLVDISESLVKVPDQMKGCSITIDSKAVADGNKVYGVSEKKSSPKKVLRTGECLICLEDFGCRPLASTLCGHIFCKSCLETVMKKNKRCPTCRKVIKKNGFHRIFL